MQMSLLLIITTTKQNDNCESNTTSATTINPTSITIHLVRDQQGFCLLCHNGAKEGKCIISHFLNKKFINLTPLIASEIVFNRHWDWGRPKNVIVTRKCLIRRKTVQDGRWIYGRSADVSCSMRAFSKSAVGTLIHKMAPPHHPLGAAKVQPVIHGAVR